MSRKKRKYVDSEIYHIIIRGNNKQNIFYDDNDKIFLIKRIEKYSKQLDIKIFAYCLMENHVHIMIGNANKNMSKFMLKLNTSYSRTFNRKYDRVGHLFQGRYLSNPIENDSEFKTVIRYIFQNPIKVGFDNFFKYKWNSVSLMNENNNQTFIDKEYIYSIFDNQNNFYNFIIQKNNDVCMDYENKYFLSDKSCYNLIRKIIEEENPLNIIRKNVEEQKKYIKKIKKLGIPINQISRITGISRYIIKIA